MMIVLLVIVWWLRSVYQIPKETAPDIKFGIISISTIYPGVNPVDIDSIITQKIEEKIEELDGISKMTSASSLWISTTTLELENGVDTSKVIADIKDKIDTITFPDDVEDSRVVEISTNNELLFRVALYAKESDTTLSALQQQAQEMIDALKGKDGIVDIQMVWWDFNAIGGRTTASEPTEIRVLIDKSKATSLWLTISEITNAIRIYNRNQPLWNHVLGELSYDFRIQWELNSLEDLKNVPIRSRWASVLLLKDVADISIVYKNENLSKVWRYQGTGYYGIELTFFKKQWTNIFDVSRNTRENIANFLSSSSYSSLGIVYTFDLATEISESYITLWESSLQTILFVFLVVFVFIGWKEWLLITLSFPLAIFVAFMVLYSQGLTLNFLTNFSLVLTFGIGVDTIMVVIEAAYENIKKWFSSKNAVLIAVKDYAAPLIASAATNIVVFLPLLFLPGTFGKFLAYIPITIIATLTAGIFLALTLNPAIFSLVIRPRRIKQLQEDGSIVFVETYEQWHNADTMSDSDRELLQEDRKHKIPESASHNWRERLVGWLTNRYIWVLEDVVRSRVYRLLLIVTPFFVLIATFVFLSPRIGFKLFPSGDNPTVRFTVQAALNTDSKVLEWLSSQLDTVLSSVPEVKNYFFAVNRNTINITVTLLDQEDRERDSFEIEKEMRSLMGVFESQWYTVTSQVQAWWPPVGKAVGIQLIARSSQQLEQLSIVSDDVEGYMKLLTGATNITNSSTKTPGQFVFSFNQQEVRRLWLNSQQLMGELFVAMNGIKAWTIKSEWKERDISVSFDVFEDGVSPQDVLNLRINTPQWPILVWSIASYSFQQSVSSLRREGGELSVLVESDLLPWFSPAVVQTQVEDFFDTYQLPDGIRFVAKGENASQSDLIISTVVSLFIAVFMIFSILVLQFNSYRQPLVILYVIVLALIGVNIGLFVTGNPYSLPFGIGFVSLVGIIVNDAIVMIDRINSNLAQQMNPHDAVLEAGRTRLISILITTISTVTGIATLVGPDAFWAGLWYTIIFWLTFCTILTLYVIPALYFEIFLTPPSESFIRARFSKTLVAPIKARVTKSLSKTSSVIQSRIRSFKNKEKNS